MICDQNGWNCLNPVYSPLLIANPWSSNGSPIPQDCQHVVSNADGVSDCACFGCDPFQHQRRNLDENRVTVASDDISLGGRSTRVMTVSYKKLECGWTCSSRGNHLSSRGLWLKSRHWKMMKWLVTLVSFADKKIVSLADLATMWNSQYCSLSPTAGFEKPFWDWTAIWRKTPCNGLDLFSLGHKHLPKHFETRNCGWQPNGGWTEFWGGHSWRILWVLSSPLVNLGALLIFLELIC